MIKKTTALMTILLIDAMMSPSSALTNPEASTLLTTADGMSQQVILFQIKEHEKASIAGLHIHYLNSTDCQSGYAGLYATPKNNPAFPIPDNQPFALDAHATYEAGVHALGGDAINAVQSILIRFINSSGQLAYFSGSCQDQGINCCVPVDCSNQTGTCVAKQNNTIQLFSFEEDTTDDTGA